MKTWMAVLPGLFAAGAVAGPQQAVEERRPATRDGLVEIENPAGSVRVIGWDRAEVVVTGTLGKGAHRLVLRGESKRTRIEVEAEGNPNEVRTDLEVKVPLGSPCSGNTIPGLFGTTKIALVDGFDHSGNVYYAWCDQGVYQTPQNYPMTQSGPVPAPM